MMQVAIAAGLICGVIVFAYFIAIDQYRAAAANGGHVAGAVRQPFLKQLESLMRPVSRLPARTAIQIRQKLSQAGNPAALTPAGFQALRYSLAALLAIAGLAGRPPPPPFVPPLLGPPPPRGGFPADRPFPPPPLPPPPPPPPHPPQPPAPTPR